MSDLLRTLDAAELAAHRHDPVDAATLAAAAEILQDVRLRGEEAVRAHALRLGDLQPGDPLVLDRWELERAAEQVDADDLALLERTAERIRRFAAAQMESWRDVSITVPGGEAGHTIMPVQRAGCYAPGGRFPLPSSVLMTAVTARAAGVSEVWLASPRPAAITLAAAAVAGVDALLCVGGAQAISALAYSAGPVPACDAIVGPGNRWVTAAKQLVAGRVAIDMLAGPSELLILTDHTADPDIVAADLLAQAEHDPDALPLLVTTDATQITRVNAALRTQLETLPTAEIARQSLRNGFAVVARDIDHAIAISDEIAPEHLEVITIDAAGVAGRCRSYGGVFIGAGSTEVLGDYGAGPNHTLPTGGTARSFAGLSVFTFLRAPTWLRMDASPDVELLADTARLARLERLEAHARAAERRA